MRTPPFLSRLLIPILVLGLVGGMIWLQASSPQGEDWFETAVIYFFVGLGGLVMVINIFGGLFRLFYQVADNIYGLYPDSSGEGFHLFTETVLPNSRWAVSGSNLINYFYIKNNGATDSYKLYSTERQSFTTMEVIFKSEEWQKIKEKAYSKKHLELSPVEKSPSKFHLEVCGDFPKTREQNLIYLVSQPDKLRSYLLLPGFIKPLKLLGSWRKYTSDHYYIDEERLVLILEADIFGPLDFLFLICIDVKKGKKLWKKLI